MNATAINLLHKTESKSEKQNPSAKIINFPRRKNKSGRPSSYTPELAEEICFAIMSSDKGIGQLCKEYKHWPNKQTIFTWIKKNKGFKRQYEVAKRIQIEWLMDELLDMPGRIDVYKDAAGNEIINPFSVQQIKVEMDKLKWKIAHLMPRRCIYEM